jgi:hypothetical protein
MAKRDDEGGGGEPLDKVLSKLDSLGKRMDALETGAGSKNPLKADKGRKDDDEDDPEDKDTKDDNLENFGEKKAAPFGKSDKKSDDGDDDGEEDPDKKPPPVVADKKKDSRKDQGSAPPPAASKSPAPPPPPVADKKKNDDDDDEDDDDRKDDDDDDDDRRDDKSTKADSVKKLRRQMDAQSKEIARLNSMMKPRTDDEHAAFADAQARADNVFAAFGKRAPRPLEGESLLQYRKRLATHLKPHSNTWKGVKFSQLPEPAFDIAEGQVYSDAVAAAANPTDLGAGELREHHQTDPHTGLKTIVFYGKDSFVKGMGRPARRVASFRTQFPS